MVTEVSDMAATEGGGTPVQWFLEGSLGHGNTWLMPIEKLPFTIGRYEGSSLKLSSQKISRHHAVIDTIGGTLRVRDLGSTNGTFVNRQALGGEHNDVVLQAGDVIHFGDMAFRLLSEPDCDDEEPDANPVAGMTLMVDDVEPLLTTFSSQAKEFRQMLSTGAVSPRFQPILRLPEAQPIGHELLGRGAFPGLPESPLELFLIAEHLGLEVALSQVFRRVGVAESKRLENRGMLFINMHPAEIELTPLLAALKELRDAEPSAPLALELHEKTVTDATGMKRLKAALQDMQIRLAYDDFGAGQARLLELIQAPPDYLKFDIGLIRDIHLQPTRSRQVVKTLVDIAKDLGIATLAEGVEVAEEAEVCIELGFELAQGYFYSRPFQLPTP
jgi:EAL domain-containing protein (putative c-di-GMP-specific phosphodiesterase class I)